MKLHSTAAVAVLAFSAAGCGSGTDTSSSITEPGTGTITVFAAASLRAAFTQIGKDLQTDNPGASIEFSFAGSSDLVTQLTQGAPADVFASADTRTMDRAAQQGLLGARGPVDFATNTLTIAVAPGNPENIASFRDLARPGLDVVVCAPPVPCGAATDRLEQASGVTLSPVSEESSVTDVLNKVTSGEADAGVVYVTDAAGAGDAVTAVDFPEAAEAVNTYPIAVLAQSGNTALAQEFVDAVTGKAGQRVLADDGFSPAP